VLCRYLQLSVVRGVQSVSQPASQSVSQSVSQVGDWTSLARVDYTYSVRLLVVLVQGKYGLVTEGVRTMRFPHWGLVFKSFFLSKGRSFARRMVGMGTMFLSTHALANPVRLSYTRSVIHRSTSDPRA
jgi:hypothetical protein